MIGDPHGAKAIGKPLTQRNEMKNVRWLLAVAGLMGALTTRAETDGSTFVIVGAGVNFLQDITFPGSPSVTQSFETGVRVDGTFGYNLFKDPNVAIAVAGEVGFLYNALDDARASTGESATTSGDFFQWPFLAKVMLTIMPGSDLSGFIGAGGGGIYSRMELDRVGSSSPGFKGDETDPAFQAEAGVLYKIGDNMKVGLAYKCLMLFPGDGFDEIINHSLTAAFNMDF
jgi:opacity protein-like surface antigen